jgi:hypothetical protein
VHDKSDAHRRDARRAFCCFAYRPPRRGISAHAWKAARGPEVGRTLTFSIKRAKLGAGETMVFQIPRTPQSAREQGRLVLFAGHGGSMATGGIPGWFELCRSWGNLAVLFVAVLFVGSLAAAFGCGGRSGTVGIDAAPTPTIDAASPDAATPDAAPECGNPCRYATGLLDFTYPQGVVVRDGVLYAGSWSGVVGGDDVGRVDAIAPDGHVSQIADHLNRILALAVDANRVYWSNQGPISAGRVVAAKISWAPRAGGAPPVDLFTKDPETFGPASAGLAVDDAHVYFDSLVRVLTLSRIPLAGGSVETIADDRLAEPGMLVASGTDLYWSSVLDSSAVAMAKSGGMIRELIPGTGISFGGPIAVDDRNVYFGSIRLSDNNLAKNDLLERPLAAGPAVPLLQDGTFLRAFAVDAENVYVSVILNDVSGVYRVPIAGGEAVRIAPQLPSAIAVDDVYVYWIDGGDVYRFQK